MSSATPQGTREGAQEPRRPGQNPRAGFSLVEVLIAIMLMALVYAIAMPSLAATRVRASVHNSKHVVVSNISLARTAAIRFGRLAVLQVDSEGDRIWVEVDTTLAGSGARDTLAMAYLRQELGVDLKSTRTGVCFNGRGIGTISSECPRPGAAIILARDGRADTVFISPLGRVVTR